MAYLISIDVGISGAVCLIDVDSREYVTHYRFDGMDYLHIAQIFDTISQMAISDVVVEQVSAWRIPAKSAETFMGMKHCIYMQIHEKLGRKPIEIQPSAWKVIIPKSFSLNPFEVRSSAQRYRQNKQTAIAYACKESSGKLCVTTKDADVAEAYLIGKYYLRLKGLK